MVTTTALWHLIKSSDLFTKGIVYLLVIVTFIVFVLSFYAILLLKNKIKSLKDAFHSIMHNQENLSEIIQKTPSANFLHFIIGFLKKQPKKVKQDSESNKELMYYFAYYFIQKEQRIISFLAACASAAPLVGLLGTVWGIIHAFMAMASSGGGDLSAVAPGIAEALITTLAGLLVAIPSLLFYHLLSKFKQEYVYYSDIIIIHFFENKLESIDINEKESSAGENETPL
jgi:biopolymer transport protein ExbB/TolQ